MSAELQDGPETDPRGASAAEQPRDETGNFIKMSATTESTDSTSTESQNNDDNNQSRQVATRVLGNEVNAVEDTLKMGEDQRAPVNAILPSGGMAGRVLIMGTLTEAELNTSAKGNDYYEAQVFAPDETVYVYAGQYQQDAFEALENLSAPAFVAIVGKISTYETDEGETRANIRPESVTQVDADTRDNWVVEAANATFDRVEAYQNGEEDAPITPVYGSDHSAEPFAQAAIDALEGL